MVQLSLNSNRIIAVVERFLCFEAKVPRGCLELSFPSLVGGRLGTRA